MYKLLLVDTILPSGFDLNRVGEGFAIPPSHYASNLFTVGICPLGSSPNCALRLTENQPLDGQPADANHYVDLNSVECKWGRQEEDGAVLSAFPVEQIRVY
ncbi:hypothetical protein NECAME_06347 [Necator americanus]|uniref:Uncharacterized protein n=1 Tax=Necator americanus TaxID=51031 RepID=W2TTS6_NECAM|nr:hypothetical protein NECAME_06347 [Necator americanus]ETN85480.1 hypothetical protein NECAME_06347 [Necator americanus]